MATVCTFEVITSETVQHWQLALFSYWQSALYRATALERLNEVIEAIVLVLWLYTNVHFLCD